MSYSALLFLVLASLSTVLVGVESFSYQGYIEKYLPFNIQLLVLMTFLFSILNLLRNKPTKLPRLIDQINSFIILPLTFSVTILFTLLEIFTYPNFVFQNFHIHYEIIFFLFLISLSVRIFTFDKSKITKNKNNFIFLISLLLLGIMALIKTWPGGVFNDIIREDNLLENLQVVFYGFSSILFFTISFKYFKSNKLFFIYFLIFGLGLLFITGEEISWGQRIFGISSPEVVQVNNAQGETTIHNINGLQELQPYIYLVFSGFLSFAWLLVSALPNKLRTKYESFVPSKYLIFYFLPIFFFYIHINFLSGKHWQWQEPCELLLSIGLFIFGCLSIQNKNPKISR